MTAAVAPYHQQWYAQVPRSARGPTLLGYAILVFGVMGFGGWAALAPIDGAVVTSGNFVATSQNKIVQHLEGGVIRDILVREGDTVEAAQVLMRLDDTTVKADLQRLLIRQVQLRATQARLQAEIAGSTSLDFPHTLLDNPEVPDAPTIVAMQRQQFETDLQTLQSDISIQQLGLDSFQKRQVADKAQLASIAQQSAIMDTELQGKKTLLAQNLVRKPEFYALQRARIALDGEKSRLTSEIEDDASRAAAAEQAITRLRQAAAQKASQDLQSASAELKDVEQRILMGRASLARLDVKSPVKGVIIHMNYHSAGGVIRPGNDILELLPSGDELIIEANIRPQDIAHVKVGQEALVRLTAMNQRLTPMVPGTVIFVSPDALPNEHKQSDNIYVARVRLLQSDVGTIPNFTPTPGMPAEVYIKTGEHTFFQYLVKPVRDTMSRAFRES